MVFTARVDVEQALADPNLVPVPVETGPEGSMAWLRATVARFAYGEVHVRRREFVEAELARIDVAGLRPVGRVGVVRALAGAMGLPELDEAAVGALLVVAANYFGGEDPAADDAVRLLLPLMGSDAEQAANRIGILVQACDATAALIEGVREFGDVHAALRFAPPVRVMRRVALVATRVGDVEIPAGEVVELEVGALGLAFGYGPRVCPGRAVAMALAGA
ncbi:MAG: hypothetical protein HOW97_20975 [Catenulispora sp.]|nr:hypothetical protein [Catenulispora sp.]